MTNQCGLYGRVSTVGLGQDPKQQIDVLKSVCEQKSWNIFGEYVDYCSGAKSRRPELDNLIQDCISKKINTIVCWSVDRFSRNAEHFISTVNELQSLGITFYFHQQQIDSSTPMGKCLLQMCSVLGELERTLIRERISMGVKTKMSKVGTWGRKSNLTPQVKKKVIELRNQGLGFNKIARELKVGNGTIINFLKEVA